MKHARKHKTHLHRRPAHKLRPVLRWAEEYGWPYAAQSVFVFALWLSMVVMALSAWTANRPR